MAVDLNTEEAELIEQVESVITDIDVLPIVNAERTEEAKRTAESDTHGVAFVYISGDRTGEKRMTELNATVVIACRSLRSETMGPETRKGVYDYLTALREKFESAGGIGYDNTTWVYSDSRFVQEQNGLYYWVVNLIGYRVEIPYM